MWFKNLLLYRIPAPWKMDPASLDTQLQRGAFQRCPSNEPQSRGWVSPRGDGALVYAQNRQWLIALGFEQRLLPASVVTEAVREKADEQAAKTGFPPGRKQLREMRERAVEELLPRAFTRKRTVFVWIDPVDGWLGIDASSVGKADEVIEHLRWSLDELPLKLLQTSRSPGAAMSEWLAAEEPPPSFSIDRDCELVAPADERAAVRYVRHPLEGEEVRRHLAAGKQPTRLAMTWQDRLSFVLTEKLEIKRLAFLDLVKEEAERSAEHADEQFDADFALMAGEFSRFIPNLMAALGGEIEPA